MLPCFFCGRAGVTRFSADVSIDHHLTRSEGAKSISTVCYCIRSTIHCITLEYNVHIRHDTRIPIQHGRDIKDRANIVQNQNCLERMIGAFWALTQGSTVYSSADQRKHQSSATQAFVRGIHRWPVNSPQTRSTTDVRLSLIRQLWGVMSENTKQTTYSTLFILLLIYLIWDCTIL